jgi:hypothetical protein
MRIRVNCPGFASPWCDCMQNEGRGECLNMNLESAEAVGSACERICAIIPALPPWGACPASSLAALPLRHRPPLLVWVASADDRGDALAWSPPPLSLAVETQYRLVSLRCIARGRWESHASSGAESSNRRVVALRTERWL